MSNPNIAAYPSSIATDNTLPPVSDNYSNPVPVLLTSPITAGSAAIPVSGIPANFPVIITIDSEQILCGSTIGLNLQVIQRGFNGTTVTSHNQNANVYGNCVAYFINQAYAEIKAIETALGFNFNGVTVTNNIAKQNYQIPVNVWYNFSPIQPGGSLTGGISNTITLPAGINGLKGTDARHYLYLNNGIGAAEAVLVTGGTYTPGAGGTLTFTPANNHSGAWQIQSATAGIQEGINDVGQNGSLKIAPGAWNIYGRIYNNFDVTIIGAGRYSSILQIQVASSNLFDIENGTNFQHTYRDFAVQNIVTATSGAVFFANSSNYFIVVDNVYALGVWNVFDIQACPQLIVSNCTFQNVVNSAVIFESGYQHGYFFSNCTMTSSSTTNDIIFISGTVPGSQMQNIELQGGNINIHLVATTGDQLNELQFTNITVDSYQSQGILSQNTGSGTGNSWQFTNIKGGTAATNASTMLLTGNFFDIQITNVNDNSLQSGCTAVALSGLNHVTIDGIIKWGIAGGSSSILTLLSTACNDVIASKLTARTISTNLDVGVSIQAAAHTNILITDSTFLNCTMPVSNLGTGSGPVTFRNVQGVDIAFTVPTVASAASITLGLNPVMFISGTTQITTITPGNIPIGQTITLIFTNATPGGVGTGGNIAKTQTAAQNQSLRLTWQGASWY